jgi:predicted esterase
MNSRLRGGEEYIKILSKFIEGTVFKHELFKDEHGEMLIETAAHQERDLQEVTLYILDLLMPTHTDQVQRILKAIISKASAKNSTGLKTVGVFLKDSAFRKDTKYKSVYQNIKNEFNSTMGKKSQVAMDPATGQAFSQASSISAPTQTSPTKNSNYLIVIVHGTWAHGVPFWPWPPKSTWWQWPKPFPLHLDGIVQDAVYKAVSGGSSAFKWSGGNNRTDREQASVKLKNWVDTVKPSTDPRKLIIVAHSHGGNVALLAACKKGLKIDHLILLGTPIRFDYPINLQNISVIHNVYSLGDYVQPFGAVSSLGLTSYARGDARTLGDCKEVANVLFDGNPGHTQLHDDSLWKTNKMNWLLP